MPDITDRIVVVFFHRKLECLQDDVVQTALTVSDKQKVRPHNTALMQYIDAL